MKSHYKSTSQSEILLISGASGSGKSTFIEQLYNKKIDFKVHENTPLSEKKWPIIEGNNILKGDLTEDSILKKMHAADGVTVHYDISYIFNHGIEEYKDDPIMKIVNMADKLKIIFIKPNYEKIKDQYRRRQILHTRKKTRISLIWATIYRIPKRKIVAILSGTGTLKKVNLYQTDDLLKHSHSKWEAYISALALMNPNTKIVTIEPTSGEGTKTAKFRTVTNVDSSMLQPER